MLITHVSHDSQWHKEQKLFTTGRFVYWTLLLEPVSEAKYKRIGIAMLYPNAFKLLKPTLAEFEII
jgi:hypothetical protein